MKRIFAILVICAAMASCGGGTKSGGSADSTAAADQTAKAQEPNADTSANKIGTETAAPESPAMKLIAASDCKTCHKEDVKVVGPAFKDVAAKYPPTDANIDSLANKIIKGGKGHWGDISMTPHPNLAVADAKEIVKYILSLKK